MASIAIMVGGAVLNATAFIGCNYLARALGGGDKAALAEKVRHDKALEACQAAYAKYTRDRTKLLDWIATNSWLCGLPVPLNFFRLTYSMDGKLANIYYGPGATGKVSPRSKN